VTSARFRLHVLAFATNDPQDCNAQCFANGSQVEHVLHWGQPVDEEGARGLAKFSRFGAADWQLAHPSVVRQLFHFYFISETKSAPMIHGHDTMEPTVFGSSSQVFRAMAK
jgi:hypothetical protein